MYEEKDYLHLIKDKCQICEALIPGEFSHYVKFGNFCKHCDDSAEQSYKDPENHIKMRSLWRLLIELYQTGMSDGWRKSLPYE